MAMQMGNNRARAEINVTPMIDVLLVLIIIFLMVPRDKMHGEEAEVPHPANLNTSEPEVERTVVIELRSHQQERATISINRQPVAWDSLTPTLKEIYKQRAEKVLFLKGDEGLAFEDVAQVIGAAHSADPSIQVGLMTLGGD